MYKSSNLISIKECMTMKLYHSLKCDNDTFYYSNNEKNYKGMKIAFFL
jgi:hypothetical protein